MEKKSSLQRGSCDICFLVCCLLVPVAFPYAPVVSPSSCLHSPDFAVVLRLLLRYYDHLGHAFSRHGQSCRPGVGWSVIFSCQPPSEIPTGAPQKTPGCVVILQFRFREPCFPMNQHPATHIWYQFLGFCELGCQSFRNLTWCPE